DIYSLGCTLYHMVAGQPPFPGGDLTERLLKHVEAQPEDVRKFNAKVPAGLVLVINRMLAKKPEEGYQTAAELLKDLEHLPTPSILNPREILEALAPDPKPKPKPRPGAETRGLNNALTGALGQPAQPAVIPELRYRNSRERERRLRKRASPSSQRFLVI